MDWKLEEAQQKLPELIQAIAQEPQLIFKQEQLVAVLIEPAIFQQFLNWQQRQQTSKSLATAFDDLRRLISEENYTLEIPERRDRQNPFVGTNHEHSV